VLAGVVALLAVALGVHFRTATPQIPASALERHTTPRHPHPKPRKRTPKPKPVAYTPCSGGLRFHHHPDSARGIEVHTLDCATARQFVHIAHASPCNARNCHVQGYACRTAVAGTQAVSISCVNGEQRVRWLWQGGY
jgi:hypothetical protein